VTEKQIIEECKRLAASAREKGNSSVGCVIVRNGEIITAAEETNNTDHDVTAHAEINALRITARKLGTRDLSGFTLYTTHEPCVMCSYAIRFYRISALVYLNTSQYLGGVSSAFSVLTTDEVPPHWAAPPVVVHYQER